MRPYLYVIIFSILQGSIYWKIPLLPWGRGISADIIWGKMKMGRERGKNFKKKEERKKEKWEVKG
jgi:hypothetical protein